MVCPKCFSSNLSVHVTSWSNLSTVLGPGCDLQLLSFLAGEPHVGCQQSCAVSCGLRVLRYETCKQTVPFLMCNRNILHFVWVYLKARVAIIFWPVDACHRWHPRSPRESQVPKAYAKGKPQQERAKCWTMAQTVESNGLKHQTCHQNCRIWTNPE